MDFLSSFASWFEGDSASVAWAMAGGVIVALGLIMERFSEWLDEKFLGGYKAHKKLDVWGWRILMFGICIEIADAGLTAQSLNRLDPKNLPVLNINAFAVLRVKGTEFPDLTQWDSSALSTNWGSKRATLTFCGNAPNSILSSMPSMIADDFGTGTGFSNSREYFLNFHMESVSAAIYLPLQSASKSFGAANFISLDVKFLPPQSEILGGYAFVVVNNSLGKLFRIYPQKDIRQPFPNKAQAENLAKIPPIKGFESIVVTGPKDAVAGTKISTLEPGKYTSLTNGESISVVGTFFPADFPIVGTNVPSGKFDPNW